MSFLLNLLANRKLISYIAAFLAGLWLGWYIESRIAESTLKSALASQQEALVKQCEDDKAKTERIDHELQSKVTDLSKRVAAYKLRKPATCVHIANPASIGDASARGGLVGADAVNSESLTDYAELAESYRLRLISCQNFIRIERK